ncbi:MAG: hypothetical protein WCO60_10460 [Verrucomicrobiota bacterium]
MAFDGDYALISKIAGAGAFFCFVAMIGVSLSRSLEALDSEEPKPTNIKQPDASPSTLPLYFKDSLGLFEYACRYMSFELKEGACILGIVLDARNFGVETPVAINSDKTQRAVISVASDDGGFLSIALTAGSTGPLLKPGQLVSWRAGRKLDAKLDPSDERTGWVGLIGATLKTEIIDGEIPVDALFA